ncbi:MAG: N-6 DNA methylase, partial [Acidobacteriales bacterium]|nr:N-6 DNA methylase [Terriglobales bacterium]
MIQAQIRQLLVAAKIGLSESDLGVAALEDQSEGKYRIELPGRDAIIEVRRDLRVAGYLSAGERSLKAYISSRNPYEPSRIPAILTDGIEWRLYHYQVLTDSVCLVDKKIVDQTDPNTLRLINWIEAALSCASSLQPTPSNIVSKLGADSPSYLLDFATLSELYQQHGNQVASVQVKRQLWAKLLATALGTNFEDEDALFINLTLLVIMAEIVGHAVVGLQSQLPELSAKKILSGELFRAFGVYGVVEPDFFDWVGEVAGGDEFVKSLAQRLCRFTWVAVEHDLMKLLYESIIGRETRRRLGEYYTPDWLAQEVLAETVITPLEQKVLDPSCGSGTFVFHAVRSYLAAAEDAQYDLSDAITGVVGHVFGIDVHPVAVTLARVIYLLAIGVERLLSEERPAFAVPIYLGDSLRWDEDSPLHDYAGLSLPTEQDREMHTINLGSSKEEPLRFPDGVTGNAHKFDLLVNEMADRATGRPRNSPHPPAKPIFDKFDVPVADRLVLSKTFTRLCVLHDQNRDHIWAYYVRNFFRPLWLTRPPNRVDALVGNPPWLKFMSMTGEQKTTFRRMSDDRGLWEGMTVAPSQDLSALFVVRCIERYLLAGAVFGFVMPWATLGLQPFAGFRTGRYSGTHESVRLAFSRPWDLHRIKPSFFPIPACAVFGTRLDAERDAAALTLAPEAWAGRFKTATASRKEAAANITRVVIEGDALVRPRSSSELLAEGRNSTYFDRFTQGATVVPRKLLIVERGESSPLGTGPDRRISVRSSPSAKEKMPWKKIPPLTGIVEERFLRPLCAGSSVLPFMYRQPAELVVVPWDGEQLLGGRRGSLDYHQGLARWWRQAEGY